MRAITMALLGLLFLDGFPLLRRNETNKPYLKLQENLKGLSRQMRFTWISKSSSENLVRIKPQTRNTKSIVLSLS